MVTLNVTARQVKMRLTETILGVLTLAGYPMPAETGKRALNVLRYLESLSRDRTIPPAAVAERLWTFSMALWNEYGATTAGAVVPRCILGS